MDEVQKLSNWSETVKRLWDEDTRNGRSLHVVLLGSSPLLMQHGLTESMAGRFEVIHIPHWSYAEMKSAFGWDLDQYLFFGGYPGGARLIADEDRWRTCVRESLVETTIARDILFLKRVDKPGLMRQLMALASQYSGQIVSFTKLLGQLQDSGNTTIISDYLHTLGSVGMVSGLQKFSASAVRQRASSPKLQVWNTGLLTSASNHTFKSARDDRVFWGHLVESAAGAHLLNSTRGTSTDVFYWAAHNRELDFVLRKGTRILGIEAKSGRPRAASGLGAFLDQHPGAGGLVVGEGGMDVATFLSTPAEVLFEQ
jgi:predicted AAA+ superfamily ATPase